MIDAFLSSFQFLPTKVTMEIEMMKELILMATSDDPSLTYPETVRSFVSYKNARPKGQLLPYSKIVDENNPSVTR